MRARDTIWADGSRFGSGEVGAACAWNRRGEGWTGKRFRPGTNKEVFGAEAFATYQALRTFEEGGESGRSFTVFSDSQSAIRRVLTNALIPGKQWAIAIIEVGTRLVDRGSGVALRWVPAHKGVAGNEFVDDLAKEAAAGLAHGVRGEIRWLTSLPRLFRRIIVRRASEPAQWVTSHVRPERRHRPPSGTKLHCKALRKVRKSLAGRY